MNKNYLQVRNPQDLRKIANINLAIDTAYNESNHYVAPKELQAIKDFIIEKSIFENYGKGENLDPKDNYYFSKNVFDMFKKYPWKILKNEFSNIKNNFEEDYQINKAPEYYKGYSLGDIAAWQIELN